MIGAIAALLITITTPGANATMNTEGFIRVHTPTQTVRARATVFGMNVRIHEDGTIVIRQGRTRIVACIQSMGCQED